MDIDFKTASEYLLANIEVVLPGGKWKGNEYFAYNPKRQDSKLGSFKINKSGIWSDFATNDKGSDGVSLYAYVFDLTQSEAAKEIMQKYGHMNYRPTANTKKEDEWTQICPVPNDVVSPNFKHKEHGSPVATWKYMDREGRLLFYTSRYNTADGKVIIPFIYGTNGKYKRWIMKAPQGKRPLYNLNNLKDTGKVLIVEGEKCVDAAQKLFGQKYSIITWQGGAKSLHKSDWSILEGREIIIWPDNDEPGIEAARAIAGLLNAKTKILQPPREKPEGWDIFDGIEEGFDCISFIEGTVSHKLPYRALGSIGKTYYFISGRNSDIITLTPSEMKQNHFLALAPLAFWQMEYPGKNGCQWDVVADTLINQCTDIGSFNPDRLRGKGVWYDDGRYIVHKGDKLYINNTEIDTDAIESKYIYEPKHRKEDFYTKPLKKEDSNRFIDLLKMLIWERPEYAILLAGWCAVAPICGCIEWRPHIWLTGQAGSGKSWIIRKIIKKIIGEDSVFTQGESSEAGIRQELGNDAVPVILDEAESDEKNQAERIQSILTLMRQASSQGDTILKGSPSGKSTRFKINSCFLFASIGVNTHHHADESRITVLSLKTDESDNREQKFKDLQRAVNNLLTEEYCGNFKTRIYNMIPTIIESSKVFSMLIAGKMKSQRFGDQLGILLAGAYALFSDNIVTEEIAEKWISKIDFSDEEEKKEINDEQKCLNAIVQSMIRINNTDYTIGELISCCYQQESVNGISVADSDITLRRYGIRYQEEFKSLFIGSNNNNLKKLLQNTPYSVNYTRMLRRIKGAEAWGVVRFTDTITQRTTRIPIDLIILDSKESKIS